MSETRTRMLEAAVQGLQRDGVAGTSFTDVLEASGAARGGIYHHFPAGKTQLLAEASARNGEEVRAHLSVLPGGTPVEVVEAFLSAVRPVVEGSAAGGGCAVAAVTVGGNEELRRSASRAFDSWVDTLSGRLGEAGLPGPASAELATTLIVMLEGAHVLCRASASVEPFERTARAALVLAGTLEQDA